MIIYANVSNSLQLAPIKAANFEWTNLFLKETFECGDDQVNSAKFCVKNFLLISRLVTEDFNYSSLPACTSHSSNRSIICGMCKLSTLLNFAVVINYYSYCLNLKQNMHYSVRIYVSLFVSVTVFNLRHNSLRTYKFIISRYFFSFISLKLHLFMHQIL